MRRYGPVLALLAACSPPADRYAEALSATDFDSAWALCEDAGANRADCQEAASKHFGRFERCGEIADGVWRDECRFAEAEHLSRQKDRPGALRACGTTRYAANCEQHVLDSLAMDLREAPPADVAAAYEGLEAGITGKNSELDYWRSWHRVRLDAGLPIVAEACQGSMCRLAGKLQVRKAIGDRLQREGCGPTPPTLPSASPKVASWVEGAWRDRCCREGGACGPPGIELAGQTE